MFRNSEPVRVRRIASDDDVIGGCVIKPRYHATTFFPGWGPKLFAVLFAAALACAGAHPSDAQIAQADCPIADRPASVVEAATPAYPRLDWEPGVRTVGVQVDLTTNGTLAGASIAQSSGIAQFDWEALRVARESRYEAAIDNCRPAGGTFLYLVTFGS